MAEITLRVKWLFAPTINLQAISKKNEQKNVSLIKVVNLWGFAARNRWVKCTWISSVGGIVIADEFDPMSVHSKPCNPALYPSLGSKPGGVFFSITSASWGCGVTDSIGGFEPLDPGSTPGTLTGLSLLQGHVNVVDITGVCDTPDLGSNPSMPANSKQNGNENKKYGDEYNEWKWPK